MRQDSSPSPMPLALKVAAAGSAGGAPIRSDSGRVGRRRRQTQSRGNPKPRSMTRVIGSP
eukprot:6941516-Pyramimonas_sp.AAC.1